MVYRILLALLLLISPLRAEEAHDHHHHHDDGGKRQLETPLGIVSVPANSTWETRAIADGTLYIGKRPGNPPQVYMATVGNSGASILWGMQRRMDEMARKYCDSLAGTFQTGYENFQNRLTDRGCQFGCRLKDGGTVFGRIYLGRYNTLTLAGVDCSQKEFDEYVQSLAPAPNFVLPSGPYDSSARIGFGYGFVCGVVNLVFALLICWYHSDEPRRASDWISSWLVGLLVLEGIVPIAFAARLVPESWLLGVLTQALVEHLVVLAVPPLVVCCWLTQRRQKALDKRKEPG